MCIRDRRRRGRSDRRGPGRAARGRRCAAAGPGRRWRCRRPCPSCGARSSGCRPASRPGRSRWWRPARRASPLPCATRFSESSGSPGAPPGYAPRLRADSGLFSAEVAGAALAADADFAIAAARNPAVRRAIRSIPKTAWRQAKGMPGAQVATIDYAPAGWPVGTRMIVRRMKVKAADISTDVRARRRRTFDPAQLALALGGQIGHAYAYSPIVTNLTGSAVAIEAWFRDRAWVEERIKDSKLGMALRHLPSVIFRRRSGQRVDLRVCLVDGVVDAALPSLLSAWADGLGALLPGRVAAGRLACGLGCACRAEGFG